MNSARFEALMSRYRLQAAVATSPENIFYTTGYPAFQYPWNRFAKASMLIVGRSRPMLSVPMAEIGFIADHAAASTCDVSVFGGSNFRVHDPVELDETERWITKTLEGARVESPVQAVLDSLAAHVGHHGRIAVDQSGTPDLLDNLRERGPSYEFVEAGEEIWRLCRMVKTPQEIIMLGRAAQINEAAIGVILAHLGQISDAELALVYSKSVNEAGGIVQHYCSGAGRLAGVFRYPQTVMPRPGDRWRFDAGLVAAGYCSDLGGTAQIGAEPTDAERHTYAAITAGVLAGLEAARPGLRASELYVRIQAAVRQSGLPNYMYSLAGHGIGIEPRDYPIVGAPMMRSTPYWTKPFDPELEVGMVLNIEVPVVDLLAGGYQNEVTFVLEASGVRLLSPVRDYVVVPTPNRPHGYVASNT